MIISNKHAREFLLAYQYLLPPRSIVGEEGIIDYIKKVGCIQYDPLNMAGTNPCLVLQSRIKSFSTSQLEKLLYVERKLIDGWDKNMSIYSIDDWPFFARYREEAFTRYADKERPIHEILPDVRKVLEEGPKSSIELTFDRKVDWAWAPTRIARAALESMQLWGELTIHHRVGTRKIYAFSSKFLPKEILNKPDPNITIEQYIEWHVKRRIGAIGILWDRASDAWLGIHWMKTKERTEAIKRLCSKGEIILIQVENSNYPFYIRKEEVDLLTEVVNGIAIDPQVSFIAPLDNLLWDRKLIRELFNFEYIWEVYKPVTERKYGYYVLPVLYGNSFVARFEPKFNKKTKELEIINWWWEQDTIVTKQLKVALNKAFNQFMSYLGATKLQIDNDVKGLEFLNIN